MEQTRKKSSWRTVYPICLLFAVLFLLLCTKSSPLFPLNDWVDANIYFTIGKGMMHGHVPYLDLYDQKGPIAFLLFGLASLVSGTSFFGVYLLETIAFSFFLFASYRIVALYTERYARLTLPVLSAFVLGSMSFSHGGSFEELMMPLFAWSLYDTLRYFKQDYPNPVPLKMIARNALFAGIMLFGKFNLLAFYPHIVEGHTIRVSPLVTKGFNMDFDGDQANFHVPVSDKAVEQTKRRMLPSVNLFSLTDLQSVRHSPSMEMTMGLYWLTRPASKKQPIVFRTVKDAEQAYREGKIAANDPIEILGR